MAQFLVGSFDRMRLLPKHDLNLTTCECQWYLCSATDQGFARMLPLCASSFAWSSVHIGTTMRTLRWRARGNAGQTKETWKDDRRISQRHTNNKIVLLVKGVMPTRTCKRRSTLAYKPFDAQIISNCRKRCAISFLCDSFRPLTERWQRASHFLGKDEAMSIHLCYFKCNFTAVCKRGNDTT